MQRTKQIRSFILSLPIVVSLSACHEEPTPAELCGGNTTASTPCEKVVAVCECCGFGGCGDVNVDDQCDDDGTFCAGVCTSPWVSATPFGYECSAVPLSCGSWDPDSQIWASGNDVEIDLALLTDLYSDPTPLFNCDTARIVYTVETGNVIDDPSTDDAAYLAGLRDGDKLISVNSYSITTPAGLLAAFIDLWFVNPTSSLTVVVNRGGSNVTLNWDIIASKP